MPLIPYRELHDGMYLFAEAYSTCDQERTRLTYMALFEQFLGDQSGNDYDRNADGFHLSEEACRRFRMLMGPHRHAIVRAWCIKKGDK